MVFATHNTWRSSRHGSGQMPSLAAMQALDDELAMSNASALRDLGSGSAEYAAQPAAQGGGGSGGPLDFIWSALSWAWTAALEKEHEVAEALHLTAGAPTSTTSAAATSTSEEFVRMGAPAHDTTTQAPDTRRSTIPVATPTRDAASRENASADATTSPELRGSRARAGGRSSARSSTTLLHRSTTTTATNTTSATSTAPIEPPTTSTSTTTRFFPSLYCYMVVRVPSYEVELSKVMQQKQASIFACDGHRIFGNGGTFYLPGVGVTKMNESPVGMGDFGVPGTATNSWLNVRIFMEAWQTLLDEGDVTKYDWTVKIDPDAVFYPERLRVWLKPFVVPGDIYAKPWFVANCDRTYNNEPPSLKVYGALEVFSRSALMLYNVRSRECMKALPWQRWGEDLFMQQCMQMLKVEVANGVGIVGDARCHWAPCSDQSKIAFHDFKNVGDWLSCWGQASSSQRVQVK